MASGVLAGRNESNWTQPRARLMAKTLISNPRSNPNPNSSAPSKRQQQKQIYANGGQFNNGRCTDESPGVATSVSDDAATSMNHNKKKPFKHGNVNNSGFNQGAYLSFDVSSYSRKEMIELKNRLVEELDRIRSLTAQIENGELGHKSNNNDAILGSKRANALPYATSGRESKRVATDVSSNSVSLMKTCGQVLGRLMKQKHGWVFNTPVDVVSMGLHDYLQIIKNPMDLGTVKSKLWKNLYPTPIDFAADVRLTFDNAMLYNPKGHEVYTMAEQFLSRFEDLFQPIYNKLGCEENQKDSLIDDVDEELQEESPWSSLCSPRGKVIEKFNPQPPPIPPKIPDRVQASTSATASNPPSSSVHSPVPTPSSPVRQQPVKPFAVSRASHGKLPKPRAKDPNKRAMSSEEKQRLGIGLQILPQEKMVQVIQIIRKRNGHLTDEGDEIELDIDVIDTETLWELDRLVTNWKKMVSKIKRQSLMGNHAQPIVAAADRLPVSEGPLDAATGDAKRPKKGEAGEEDVDIGDEMPVSSFPPVEIDKDDGPATSSSSSSSSYSSDSSSSSDSYSGSSSGSDSDVDEDVQSRGPESKTFSKT